MLFRDQAKNVQPGILEERALKLKDNELFL